MKRQKAKLKEQKVGSGLGRELLNQKISLGNAKWVLMGFPNGQSDSLSELLGFECGLAGIKSSSISTASFCTSHREVLPFSKVLLNRI
ncbi:MAG: hypothetical protein ABI378_01750 [Chitinophagaceae bacterium]